jgi:hypothetical protein
MAAGRPRKRARNTAGLQKHHKKAQESSTDNSGVLDEGCVRRQADGIGTVQSSISKYRHTVTSKL